MFWTRPTVMLAGGRWPLNANVMEMLGTEQWQRWSRHRTVTWLPFVDHLEGFVRSIIQDLRRPR
jgi:hypothetical protein